MRTDVTFSDDDDDDDETNSEAEQRDTHDKADEDTSQVRLPFHVLCFAAFSPLQRLPKSHYCKTTKYLVNGKLKFFCLCI